MKQRIQCDINLNIVTRVTCEHKVGVTNSMWHRSQHSCKSNRQTLNKNNEFDATMMLLLQLCRDWYWIEFVALI